MSFSRVLALGLLDASSTALTGSVALLDFNLFQKGTISEGSPILISPTSDADLAAHGRVTNGKGSAASQGTNIPRFRNDTTRHLFVAHAMDPNMTENSPSVQVCRPIAASAM